MTGLKFKKETIICTIFASIAMFSVGFASFITNNITTSEDTFENGQFNVGTVTDQLNGIYLVKNSGVGFDWYIKDGTYYYSKTSIDFTFIINKEELKNNENGSTLNVSLSCSNNFLQNINTLDYATIEYEDASPYIYKSNSFVKNSNQINATFLCISDDNYDINKFANKFFLNTNEIRFTVSFYFEVTDTSAVFNVNVYKNCTFTISSNAGIR